MAAAAPLEKRTLSTFLLHQICGQILLGAEAVGVGRLVLPAEGEAAGRPRPQGQSRAVAPERKMSGEAAGRADEAAPADGAPGDGDYGDEDAVVLALACGPRSRGGEDGSAAEAQEESVAAGAAAVGGTAAGCSSNTGCPADAVETAVVAAAGENSCGSPCGSPPVPPVTWSRACHQVLSAPAGCDGGGDNSAAVVVAGEGGGPGDMAGAP